MKNIFYAALAGIALSTGAYAAASVDTIDYTNGGAGTFFVPPGGFETSDPYYRGNGEDWGWTHGALMGGFTSAVLNISAYDVDEGGFGGEVDEIYVLDEGALTLLGTLEGDDDSFSFTAFDLDPSLFNEVEAGLEVFMRIDTGDDGWFVSLAKSTITLDGAGVGNPNPCAQVPLPAAGWVLLAGLGGLAAVRRRRG